MFVYRRLHGHVHRYRDGELTRLADIESRRRLIYIETVFDKMTFTKQYYSKKTKYNSINNKNKK